MTTQDLEQDGCAQTEADAHHQAGYKDIQEAPKDGYHSCALHLQTTAQCLQDEQVSDNVAIEGLRVEVLTLSTTDLWQFAAGQLGAEATAAIVEGGWPNGLDMSAAHLVNKCAEGSNNVQ